MPAHFLHASVPRGGPTDDPDEARKSALLVNMVLGSGSGDRCIWRKKIWLPERPRRGKDDSFLRLRVVS
jgi:hypothetical protein